MWGENEFCELGCDINVNNGSQGAAPGRKQAIEGTIWRELRLATQSRSAEATGEVDN